MSDLTTYRAARGFTGSLLKRLIAQGALVPDTRLQAIADAPRCVHGNVYLHTIEDSIEAALLIDNPADALARCEGAPELAALLDALVKEDQ